MNSPSIFDPVSLRADLTELEDENARMLATITAIREYCSASSSPT